MKHYVTWELRCVETNAKDVITASNDNDVEYDVREWLGGLFGQ